MSNIIKLYFADWCGHCKSFQSTWNEIKQKISEIPDSITKEVEHSEMTQAELETVSGFPTIRFFKEGEQQDYNGERTLDNIMDAFKKFINLPVKLTKSPFVNSGGAINSPYYKKYLKYKKKYLSIKYN